MKILPWTSGEKEKIAELRDQGFPDSYIMGFMKAGSRKGNCPLLEKVEMATKKKGSKKKEAVDAAAQADAGITIVKEKPAKKAKAEKAPKVAKAPKVVAARKPKGVPGRKAGSFLVGETLVAVPGKEAEFYTGFPRGVAYGLLCKKKKMKTADFVNEVEKLDGVKSRGQALGILTKLLKKGAATSSDTEKAA
jgi:hypothetical protein